MQTPPSIETMPASFSLLPTDDQRDLLEPIRRFSREQLRPMLVGSSAGSLGKSVGMLSQLGLGTALQPSHLRGLGINATDLCLLLEEFATGPLALATELTLAAPALTMLREIPALEHLLSADAEVLFGSAAAALAPPPGSTKNPTYVLARQEAGPLLLIAPAEHEGLGRAVWVPTETTASLLAQGQDAGRMKSLRLVRVELDVATLGQCQCVSLETHQLRNCVAWYCLWLSALLTGAAQAAVGAAFDYAQTRTAFQRPIIHHQAVALRLADMAIAADGAHLMLLDAAARLSAAQDLDWGQQVQLARRVASASLEVHRHAVQVNGGHGYVEGLPTARQFQDASVLAHLLLDMACRDGTTSWARL